MSAAQELFSKGTTAFVDEDHTAALEHFSSAIELDGTNPDFFVKRSATLTKLDRFEEALEDADTALKLDPENARAHFRKGSVTLFIFLSW